MTEQAPPPVIVVHKRAPVPEGYMPVYIGRPSPLGNPFIIGKHGTRAEVIELFSFHLTEAMCGPTEENTVLWCLAERVRKGQRLALQCWCAPKACHGDVIAEEILRAVGYTDVQSHTLTRLLERAPEGEPPNEEEREAIAAVEQRGRRL